MSLKPAHGSYCRICGSHKLNKFYFALDFSNKVSLNQVLTQDKSVDELIRPCECRGDFAFAHRICLSNWIETTKHEYCDVCCFRYNVVFVKPSILDWISETKQVERILKALSIALVIYHISVISLLVCRNKPLVNLIEVAIVVNSYCWILGCSVSLLVYFHKLLREFLVWRLTSKSVFVEPNYQPQLDSQPIPKDVLKSSGFRP